MLLRSIVFYFSCKAEEQALEKSNDQDAYSHTVTDGKSSRLAYNAGEEEDLYSHSAGGMRPGGQQNTRNLFIYVSMYGIEGPSYKSAISAKAPAAIKTKPAAQSYQATGLVPMHHRCTNVFNLPIFDPSGDDGFAVKKFGTNVTSISSDQYFGEVSF